MEVKSSAVYCNLSHSCPNCSYYVLSLFVIKQLQDGAGLRSPSVQPLSQCYSSSHRPIEDGSVPLPVIEIHYFWHFSPLGVFSLDL